MSQNWEMSEIVNWGQKNELNGDFGLKNHEICSQRCVLCMSTSASGLGRLVLWTGLGWEELRVFRAVLAFAMDNVEATGCDELGAVGTCTG